MPGPLLHSHRKTCKDRCTPVSVEPWLAESLVLDRIAFLLLHYYSSTYCKLGSISTGTYTPEFMVLVIHVYNHVLFAKSQSTVHHTSSR